MAIFGHGYEKGSSPLIRVKKAQRMIEDEDEEEDEDEGIGTWRAQLDNNRPITR